MFRIDTKGNSKRARIDEPDNEEQLLESIVFRDSKSVLNNLKEKQLVQERKGIQLDEDSEEDLNEEQISFIIDNQGDQELLEKTKDVSQSTAAVWQDDDDDIG